jgi:hypothetical protein
LSYLPARPGRGAFQGILADIALNGRRCPGCGEDGQAEPCVFCGQLQDPACGHGTEYEPPGEDGPGRWRCEGCGAVTADEQAATAPGQITVTVTAEDIRLGEPRSAWRDPVCRAVCRLLGVPVASSMAGTRVSIDASGLDIWPEHGHAADATYLLPDEAVAFLEAFDVTGEAGVTPLTFTARLLEGQ